MKQPSPHVKPPEMGAFPTWRFFFHLQPAPEFSHTVRPRGFRSPGDRSWFRVGLAAFRGPTLKGSFVSYRGWTVSKSVSNAPGSEPVLEAIRFVGSYVGEWNQKPGFLRWCEMFFVHSQYGAAWDVQLRVQERGSQSFSAL